MLPLDSADTAALIDESRGLGVIQHVTVYHKPGRFAGWPANAGIWSWGNEIVVGFTVGGFVPGKKGHPISNDGIREEVLARSTDGGMTWAIERPSELVPPGRGGVEPTAPGGGIDFTQPNFALTCRRSGTHGGAKSWFLYSTDRCHSWQGPFQLPMFDQTGIAARTDYQVLSQGSCLLFLTAAKPNEKEGRVFCTRTDDGGKTWRFVSWIGEEPKGFSIMPGSLRLPSGRILVALRRFDGDNWGDDAFIELFASDDEGETWRCLGRPAEDIGANSNPANLIRLPDGRLALIYGYRKPTYGMHGRLSSDDGATWSEPIVLRDDGGNWDLGYPQSVLRPDGTIVSVYYYNEDPDQERYIAATLWKP